MVRKASDRLAQSNDVTLIQTKTFVPTFNLSSRRRVLSRPFNNGWRPQMFCLSCYFHSTTTCCPPYAIAYVTFHSFSFFKVSLRLLGALLHHAIWALLFLRTDRLSCIKCTHSSLNRHGRSPLQMSTLWGSIRSQVSILVVFKKNNPLFIVSVQRLASASCQQVPC